MTRMLVALVSLALTAGAIIPTIASAGGMYPTAAGSMGSASRGPVAHFSSQQFGYSQHCHLKQKQYSFHGRETRSVLDCM